MPNIAHPLQLLKDVGLGYLTLGQPSLTLLGREAQRINLVTELSKVRDDVGKRGNKAPHTLYVLDELTVGLHMSGVRQLLRMQSRVLVTAASQKDDDACLGRVTSDANETAKLRFLRWRTVDQGAHLVGLA